jgi:hypothetical protein
MEIFVRAPEGTMIGTMLPSIIEALIVGTFVGPAEIPVRFPVLPMIASMPVVILMSERRRDRDGQRQDCCRYKPSTYGHKRFPLSRSPAYRGRGNDFWLFHFLAA